MAKSVKKIIPNVLVALMCLLYLFPIYLILTNSFKSRAGEMMVFDKGTPLSFDEDEATKILSEDHVTVFVDMHEGNESATAWGCDLTYDYVKINADYRS